MPRDRGGDRQGTRELSGVMQVFFTILIVPVIALGSTQDKTPLIEDFKHGQFIACQLSLHKAAKTRNVQRGGTCKVHSGCLINAYMFTRTPGRSRQGWGCSCGQGESVCSFSRTTPSRRSSALDTWRRKWGERQGADLRGVGGLPPPSHPFAACLPWARSWAGTRKALMDKIRKLRSTERW